MEDAIIEIARRMHYPNDIRPGRLRDDILGEHGDEILRWIGSNLDWVRIHKAISEECWVPVVWMSSASDGSITLRLASKDRIDDICITAPHSYAVVKRYNLLPPLGKSYRVRVRYDQYGCPEVIF